MAKYREAPCEYYICKGKCKKGYKDASQAGRCQTCAKYRGRKGFKCIGNKKRNAEKQRYVE